MASTCLILQPFSGIGDIPIWVKYTEKGRCIIYIYNKSGLFWQGTRWTPWTWPPVLQRPDGDRPSGRVRGLPQYRPGRSPQTEGNTSVGNKHLAHLNRRLKWAFLVDICPSISSLSYFKHFLFPFQNHWVNFNQTWNKAFLVKFKFVQMRVPPFSGDNKKAKYFDEILKIFRIYRTTKPILIKLGTKHTWVKMY